MTVRLLEVKYHEQEMARGRRQLSGSTAEASQGVRQTAELVPVQAPSPDRASSAAGLSPFAVYVRRGDEDIPRRRTT